MEKVEINHPLIYFEVFENDKHCIKNIKKCYYMLLEDKYTFLLYLILKI